MSDHDPKNTHSRPTLAVLAGQVEAITAENRRLADENRRLALDMEQLRREIGEQREWLREVLDEQMRKLEIRLNQDVRAREQRARNDVLPWLEQHTRAIGAVLKESVRFRETMRVLGENSREADGRFERLEHEVLDAKAQAAHAVSDIKALIASSVPPLPSRGPEHADRFPPALPLLADFISVRFVRGPEAFLDVYLVRDDDVHFDLDGLCALFGIADPEVLRNAVPASVLRGDGELVPGGLAAAAALSTLAGVERDAIADWLANQVLPAAEALAVRFDYAEEYRVPPRDLTVPPYQLPVLAGKIGGRHGYVVDGRTLHDCLGHPAPFAAWFPRLAADSGLRQDRDYTAVEWTHSRATGRSPVDYYLSLDAAMALIRADEGEAAERVRTYLEGVIDWLARREARVADRARRHGPDWPHEPRAAEPVAGAPDEAKEPPTIAAAPSEPASVFPADGLVPVTMGEIGGRPCQVVNARDLHEFMEVGKKFASWINGRISKYKFQENVDFACISQETFKKYGGSIDFPNLGNQKSGRGGDRRSKEYLLTPNMAKELGMIENNPKGHQIRRYFIECEKQYLEGRLSEVTPVPPRVASPAPDLLAGLPRVFEFEGQPVRVLVQDGLSWFVVKDMIEALGYRDDQPHGAGRHLDGVPANCRRIRRIQTPGGKQKMLLISEPGLRPFLDAKLKPAVPRFRRWLADEVLPALRGTAGTGLPAASPVPSPAPGVLRTFEFEAQPVRAIVTAGRPWFVARDVLRSLDYPREKLRSVNHLLRAIPAGDKGHHPVPSPRFHQAVMPVVILSIEGLRRFLEQCGRPKAAFFGAWLDREVLPALVESSGKPEIALSGDRPQ